MFHETLREPDLESSRTDRQKSFTASLTAAAIAVLAVFGSKSSQVLPSNRSRWTPSTMSLIRPARTDSPSRGQSRNPISDCSDSSVCRRRSSAAGTPISVVDFSGADILTARPGTCIQVARCSLFFVLFVFRKRNRRFGRPARLTNLVIGRSIVITSTAADYLIRSNRENDDSQNDRVRLQQTP